MNNFDSIQVKFENTEFFPSPFANTKVVPFVTSYFEILKSAVDKVNTEYFWFFSSFINMKTIDLDYIPKQQASQLHVWYNTHPKGGTNKEGNVMLVPTKQFKEQMNTMQGLRDFKDIIYHAHNNLYQAVISKIAFDLSDPISSYNKNKQYYTWLFNKELDIKHVPNFYPSFWEGVRMYSWGETNDIMLVPKQENVKQFHDIKRKVHYDLDYPTKQMDIIFISEDNPSAGKQYNELKEKFPRAKWSKGKHLSQTLAYMAAAAASKTEYFFAVPTKYESLDKINFSLQPDRLMRPCHCVFGSYDPEMDLEHGQVGVSLFNKGLIMKGLKPTKEQFKFLYPTQIVD